MPPPPTQKSHPERWATLLLLTIYLAWIVSLPAWPSQDGPVHLYYTQVLGRLLANAPTPYATFYSIKHVLPPYALYYYLLLLLSQAMPLLLADRLIICVYILSFTLGFRYLAQALAHPTSSAPDRATLAATLLVLNWSLGMGFVNYCLSLSLAFWALGLWFRFAPRRDLTRRIAFVLLAAAVTLAHPVPLLFLLSLCAFDLLLRTILRKTTNRQADLLTLLAAALSLAYVAAFTQSHPLAQRTPTPGPPLHRAFERLLGFASSKNLSLLFGHGLSIDFYRLALSALLLLSLSLALQQRLHNRRAATRPTNDSFLLAACLLLLTLPWLPSDLSGAYFFTERLTILLPVTALLAATVTPQPIPATLQKWPSTLLILLVFATTACLLFPADHALRPLARQARTWENSTALHGGDLALVLESIHLPATPAITPSWDPFYWMPVHAIRQRGAILANAPWLDSPIIPLAPSPALPGATLPPQLANSPHALTLALQADPQHYAAVTQAATVVLLRPDLTQLPTPDPLLSRMSSPDRTWHCAFAAYDLQACRPGQTEHHRLPR